MHDGNGDKEKESWRFSGVYGYDVFLLFGMTELDWILLDIGSMWGKGVGKWWGVGGMLVVELKKEEQQGK